MILLIAALLFLIIVVLLSPAILHKRYVKKLEKCNMQNIPGPKPNPFFGNMLDFLTPTYEFLDILLKYVNKYGPILKVYVGPQTSMIIATDVKLVEYILSSTQLITKAPQYEYFYNWLGTGLLTSTGAKWKKRRRMLTSAFHFSILDNFVNIFDKVGDVFIKKLESHVGEESLDIYPLVTLCTLDAICEAAMGISVNAQTKDSIYVKSIKDLCRIMTARNFSALDVRLYPLSLNYYKEKMALKIVHSHTDNIISNRIKEMDKSIEEKDDSDLSVKKKMAFLDLLLKSTIDGKPLSRADIREEVDTFMFEGHDTTSSAISFALYSLANNPLVKQKALDEQKEIFENCKCDKIKSTDLANMKYLELVIKETLRLYPSVPIFSRSVTEEFIWDGIVFPEGQQITLAPFALHRNPKYFPKPLEFIPERFLEMDGTNPYVYIPFSAGPRNCIGQKFAMMEMKTIISKVLRNFELLPANPNYKLQLAPEIILISKNGIRIALKKRA